MKEATKGIADGIQVCSWSDSSTKTKVNQDKLIELATEEMIEQATIEYQTPRSLRLTKGAFND